MISCVASAGMLGATHGADPICGAETEGGGADTAGNADAGGGAETAGSGADTAGNADAGGGAGAV